MRLTWREVELEAALQLNLKLISMLNLRLMLREPQIEVETDLERALRLSSGKHGRRLNLRLTWREVELEADVEGG